MTLKVNNLSGASDKIMEGAASNQWGIHREAAERAERRKKKKSGE